MYSVYELVDPRDESVFYVGQTMDMFRRFIQHLNCTEDNFLKNRVMWALRSLNLIPIMRVIEQVEDKFTALNREQFWIVEYLDRGYPLTNIIVASHVDDDKVVEDQPIEQKGVDIQIVEQEEIEEIVEIEIEPVPIPYPLMTDLQIIQFEALYKALGNVDKSLKQIGASSRHRPHARQIIAERDLKGGNR